MRHLDELTRKEQAAAQSDAEDMDNVVLPAHYGHFKIEPVRFSIENQLDPFQFNVVKYITRHKLKNGIEDLRKVIRYTEMYIRYLQGNPHWWTASGEAPDATSPA